MRSRVVCLSPCGANLRLGDRFRPLLAHASTRSTRKRVARDFEISSSSEEAPSAFPSRTTPWMPFSAVARCILFNQPEAALAEIARTLSRYGSLCVSDNSQTEHSAGLASFLDHVIRFGFFESIEDLNEKLLPGRYSS